MTPGRRARVAGMFFARLLFVFAIYTLVVGLLPALRPHLPRAFGSAVVSVPLQAIFAAVALDFAAKSGYPRDLFGLTWRGAGGAVAIALVLTAPLLACAVAGKWLAIRAGLLPAPLFDTARVVARLGGPIAYGAAIAVYAVFVVVQELVARGVVQTGLELFLRGPRRGPVAIALSNVLFAVTHVHISAALVAGSFVAGVLWGALFRRRRSLPAVAASHFVVGLVVYFLLGVEPAHHVE
jgi:hypothetical protein